MSRIYQAKYKNEFINNLKNKSIYKWLFDKTFDFEAKYGKDVFDFNKEQILEFISGRQMTINSLKSHLAFISSYIKWADEKNLRASSKNPISEITDEDLEKIAKPASSVLHVDTIYQLIGRTKTTAFQPLKNAQDRLLIYLLFLGVHGNRASELINLKFDHIQDGYIKLSELDPYRKDIRIDDFGLQLLENAKNEIIYQRYLDEDNIGTNDHDYGLDDSSYVFRKSQVGNYSTDERMSYQGLLARLSSISRYTGERLTMKRILRSGMVYVGKKVMEVRGDLTIDDPVVIASIFEKYNIENERMKYTNIKFIKDEINKIYKDD